MKNLLLLAMLLFALIVRAQESVSIDTTALKHQVSKAYENIRPLASLEDYKKFTEPAELLYPLSKQNQETLSLLLSKSFYDMNRNFKDADKNTILSKQINSVYLEPEVRREYLLKAKYYLEAFLGYDPQAISEEFIDDEKFNRLKYALQSVDEEIKKK